jgi:DeoR/GlpR family transcriptional regulator of sugar metabolism
MKVKQIAAEAGVTEQAIRNRLKKPEYEKGVTRTSGGFWVDPFVYESIMDFYNNRFKRVRKTKEGSSEVIDELVEIKQLLNELITAVRQLKSNPTPSE